MTNSKIKYAYYDDGNIKERWYETNGIKNGIYESWYDNGNKSLKCTYNNGRKNGPYIMWHNSNEFKNNGNI